MCSIVVSHSRQIGKLGQSTSRLIPRTYPSEVAMERSPLGRVVTGGPVTNGNCVSHAMSPSVGHVPELPWRAWAGS